MAPTGAPRLGDAGEEKGLLGDDDASTAAAALLILLQAPSRLTPRQPARINWLAIDLPLPESKILRKAVDQAAAGELPAVIATADRLASSRSATEDARAEAAVMAKTVTEHVQSRLTRARELIAALELTRALEILEPLAKELPRHPSGVAARAELAAIDSDPDLRRELDDERSLRAAWQKAYRRGMRSARDAFQRIVDDYAGTAAASQAASILG